ncbi:MAG: DUF3124 domain-containing protein [Bacteroidales bacterium]|jgi:hypothetical protein|nr:DUF3124 domain-containing protein [Bacteroidales bacterium]
MKSLVLILVAVLFSACADQKSEDTKYVTAPDTFDPATLLVKGPADSGLTGQLLYMPVYSNIPYHIVGMSEFDMSAFVAVHNTDLLNPIKITKALYFDTHGKPVFDFLIEGVVDLEPLATRDFYVPYEDKSGTGANFLIEWISAERVSEPLVESITISLKPNQSVAFLSKGRVIRESR